MRPREPSPDAMWQGRALHVSRRKCGRGRGKPSSDGVWAWAAESPVPAQMWEGRALSWCRCGRGERCPGADVAGLQGLPVCRGVPHMPRSCWYTNA